MSSSEQSLSKAKDESQNKEYPKVFANKEEYLMTIRRQFQEGFSREQAFINICSIMGIPQATPDQITEFFWLMDDDCGVDGNNPIEIDYRMQIGCVVEEYKKLQNGIAMWPSDDINAFKFLNSRYALIVRFHDANFQLFILDNFHGEER
jgi:hypothetical protein